MINQYKRQDVFLCHHDCHKKRGQHVSVYHAMRRKQCYPGGCTYFRWKCKELEKRKKCFRGFSHVGKNCFGCRYFDEEKMTRTLTVSPLIDLNETFENIYDFEEWLRDNVSRESVCFGKISSVKPRIVKSVYPSSAGTKEHSRLLGYLICFEYCYIGRSFIDDVCFAIVGCDFQRRLRFSRGDEIEFRALLMEQDGRLIFQQLKKIEFRHKSEDGKIWNDSQSLITKHTGNTLSLQADKCVECRHGFLIDVHEFRNGQDTVYHRMFCALGMKSATLCYYDLSKNIYGNTCQNRYSGANGSK